MNGFTQEQMNESVRSLLINYLVQESEGEDAADSRVTLAQDVGRGNLASRQSRVKLQEVISKIIVIMNQIIIIIIIIIIIVVDAFQLMMS